MGSASDSGQLNELVEELHHLDARVAHDDQQLDHIAQSRRPARDLMTIPGLGAKAATALLAAVGEDPRVFNNGRGLAAWIGLVPRQHATGGRERLLGISKRGDVYLRTLLIHGARAVLRWVERKEDPVSRWAAMLKTRRHTNVAVVAMANKIARIAYAVMTTGKPDEATKGALARLSARRDPDRAGSVHRPAYEEARETEYRPPRVAKSEPHSDGMKGTSCLPESLFES